MTQQERVKEVWTVRSEWSTEGNGDTYEVKDLIVFNKEQVEEYLKTNWNLENSEDYSDGDSFMFSYSAIYDELGNEVKHNIERCYEGEDSDQIKEGFYEQTDTVSAYKDYTTVTQIQIDELKARFMGHVVIDLTED